MALALRWGEPLTYDDLQGFASDGHRYELIDGTLLVTPAPEVPHQVIVLALYRLLWAARVPGTTVLTAPVDWVPEPRTVLEPDVLVVRRDDARGKFLTATPLLVVEVLSPSTAAQDRGSKRLKYEELGVPAYWLVDPAGPTLTALHLEAGRYAEVARVTGTERYDATVPYAVSVVPSALLER